MVFQKFCYALTMLQTFTVKAAFNGQRLTDVLARQESMSASLRKQIRLHGRATADGLLLRLIDRVSTGQVIEIDDGEPTVVTAASNSLQVLFEDDWYLAVNKPPGMVTHPTVHDHLPSVLDETGRALRAVGRLDKDTSGVILLAKHAHAHHAAVSHPLRKLYIGLCHGLFQTKRVTVEGPIRRSNQQYLRRVVHPDGKAARTRILRLAEDKTANVSLAAFRLDSGRTHQIRVHALYNGNPLLGDWLYGLNELEDIYPGKGLVTASRAAEAALLYSAAQLRLDDRMQRQALHALTLSFIHPADGRRVRITAPPPDDFRRFIISSFETGLSETCIDVGDQLGLEGV